MQTTRTFLFWAKMSHNQSSLPGKLGTLWVLSVTVSLVVEEDLQTSAFSQAAVIRHRSSFPKPEDILRSKLTQPLESTQRLV